MVVLQSVLTHLLAELRLLTQKRLKVTLAKAIGIHRHQSLVSELAVLFKQVFVATDYCFWTQSHVEVLLLRVGEPNGINSSRIKRLACVPTDDIDLLVNFIAFFKYVLTMAERARLKRLQELDHEAAIF